MKRRMSWFKHLTGSINDPFIFSLVHEFGGDGYMVFFRLLELFSQELNVNKPGFLVIEWSFIVDLMSIRRKKLEKIFTFIGEKKENEMRLPRIEISMEEKKITFSCNKFAELCDEYTNRVILEQSKVSGQTPDNVPTPIGTKSGESPEKIDTDRDLDRDQDLDHKNNPNPSLQKGLVGVPEITNPLETKKQRREREAKDEFSRLNQLCQDHTDEIRSVFQQFSITTGKTPQIPGRGKDRYSANARSMVCSLETLVRNGFDHPEGHWDFDWTGAAEFCKAVVVANWKKAQRDIDKFYVRVETIFGTALGQGRWSEVIADGWQPGKEVGSGREEYDIHDASF